MPRDMRDTIRKVRAATSKALKTRVRHCKNCGRGQNPHRIPSGDGRSIWQCRYCGQEQFR